MPHFVVAGGIAPKETYVVVSAVVSGRMAPPHQNDVALLRLAAGKQLLFVLEGVGGQVGVLNEVHEVAGSTHHIVRPPGAGDIGLALDVHLGDEGVGVQADFPQNVGHKARAVHAGSAIVVTGSPLGDCQSPPLYGVPK